MEFSKKLTIIDILTWSILSVIVLVLAFIKPELQQFSSSIFVTLTTMYVSLRLSYAGKAAVENYRKIRNNYNVIMGETPNGEYEELG